MSHENVEIVRRAIEAVIQTPIEAAIQTPTPDFATINALFHPDHELVSLFTLHGPAVMTVRGGKIIRTETYPSPDEALEAVGLRE
jgi:hypothetical protein